jgi:hypothetical protein
VGWGTFTHKNNNKAIDNFANQYYRNLTSDDEGVGDLGSISPKEICQIIH